MSREKEWCEFFISVKRHRVGLSSISLEIRSLLKEPEIDTVLIGTIKCFN